MYCEECGTLLPDNSAFCPECGTAVSAAPRQTAPAAQPVCPNCGEPLFAGDQFCVKCGASVAAAAGAGAAGGFAGAAQPAQQQYAQPAQQYAQPMSQQQYAQPMPPQQQPQRKSSKLPLIIGIIVAVVVIVPLVGILLLGWGCTSAVSSLNESLESESSSTTADDAASDEGATSFDEPAPDPEPAANTYELTVTAKDGAKLSGTVTRDDNDYVIADSSDRTYSVSELRGMNLTDAELCIAWNEPFARLGRHFNNPDLQRYFESCSWYVDRGYTGALSSGSPASINNANLREVAEGTSADKWKNLAG